MGVCVNVCVCVCANFSVDFNYKHIYDVRVYILWIYNVAYAQSTDVILLRLKDIYKFIYLNQPFSRMWYI